jgi:hypothetical protein
MNLIKNIYISNTYIQTTICFKIDMFYFNQFLHNLSNQNFKNQTLMILRKIEVDYLYVYFKKSLKKLVIWLF